jgi:ATP-dependent protease ClpP protease subunit
MHKLYDASSAPIELHMSSFGGCVYSALRLIDEIESAPVQIKFVGGGQIMSAATVIMSVCDHRIVHKNARIMLHDGSNDMSGRHTDIHIEADEDKFLTEVMYEIYAKNSRMPKNFWHDLCQRDTYLSADEALSLGLVDEIVQPKKRGNLRKSREKILSKHPSAASMGKLVNSLYKRTNRKNAASKITIEVRKEEMDLTLSDKAQETVDSTEVESPTPTKE